MRGSLPCLLLLLAACHSRITYPPGGYAYPGHVADKDTNFYYYPVKDVLPRRDSFYDSYRYLFYKSVNEPNLSLKPLPSPVYRFWYSGFEKGNYMISLTQNEITVKKIRNNDSIVASHRDTCRLTPLERLHVKILDKDFPIDEKNPHRSPRHHAWLDSMGRVYPQLYDPVYYRSILQKENENRANFSYTIRKINITAETFARLVHQIDTSGYWKFPPKPAIPEAGFDASGFVLEANTSEKYNMVEGCFCGGDTFSRIASIWDELLKASGIYNEIYPPDTAKHLPLIIQDVQLEDVKEFKPKKTKHHPVKTPHPN
jgi:hypothetical protein